MESRFPARGTSKAADQVARLAAIFWVFTHGGPPAPTDAIDRDTMLAAIKVGGALLFETERVTLAFSGSHGDSAAEGLLNWLLKQGEPVRRNHILRLGPAITRDRNKRDAASRVLQDRGLVALWSGPEGQQVVINPAVMAG